MGGDQVSYVLWVFALFVLEAAGDTTTSAGRDRGVALACALVIGGGLAHIGRDR